MSHLEPSPQHKHNTASVFLFGRVEQVWRLGLVAHPRFGKLMLPGGHVEEFENPAEAALRELREETGLEATLVTPVPAVSADVAGLVQVPMWIVEQVVPADSHYGSSHVHVDHLYAAVAESTAPSLAAAHDFGWYCEPELSTLAMFADTRKLAVSLFACLELVLGKAISAA